MKTESLLSNSSEQQGTQEAEEIIAEPVAEKPNLSRINKLMRSAVLGMALTFGGTEGNVKAVEAGDASTVTAVENGKESSSEQKVKIVKKGLEKLLHGDDSEKRWLATNAMERIEAHENIAEKITEKKTIDQLPPPSYMLGFIHDKKVADGFKRDAWTEFDSFRLDKKGKETKEFKKLTIKERWKKVQQMESGIVYNHFVKTEGVGMANLRVLTANKFYNQDQEKMGIDAIKRLVDINDGKEVELPGEIGRIKKEVEVLERESIKREKETTPEQAKAIKDLIKGLLESGK